MPSAKPSGNSVELWRLYDSDNKVFFNNLNMPQLHKIIEAIPDGDERYWHICKDDGDDWYPLTDKLHEITRGSQVDDGKSNRMPGVMSLGTFVEDLAHTRTSHGNALTRFEKRKINRFLKSVEVFIDVGEDILSAHTKDISLFSIKLSEKFPIKYQGKFYPLSLKVKPSIMLRCKPLITEKETVRGTWNIVTIDPNFNLSALAKFLGEEKGKDKK